MEIYSSTLDFYDQLVHAHNYEFPAGYMDMVPLSDDGKRYYTGVFSSRPNFKMFARRASQDLHASNKFFAMKAVEATFSNTTDYQSLLDHSDDFQEVVSEA